MASIWRRTMVYLGLVDDEEYEEYEPYDEPAPMTVPASAPAPAARSMGRRPMAVAEPAMEPVEQSGGVRTLKREPDNGVTLQPRSPIVRPITPIQSPRVQVVAPGGFSDAQEIGDKFKANQPVIVNLQGANRELARRLIDFASGVTYALGGKMEQVADLVFLMTPSNVDVSEDERRRLRERGLYRS